MNRSDQLNCIFDTYDKDCEQFYEQIEKLKQTTNRGGVDCTNSGDKSKIVGDRGMVIHNKHKSYSGTDTYEYREFLKGTNN